MSTHRPWGCPIFDREKETHHTVKHLEDYYKIPGHSRILNVFRLIHYILSKESYEPNKLFQLLPGIYYL